MPMILVVEDDRLLGEELRDALRRLGYSVPAPIRTGEEALRIAEDLRLDLVLVDLQLGGQMDGFATAEQLRERFGIPSIYLSPFDDEGTLQRAKLTDPFGWLPRPFTDSELRSAIELALQRRTSEARQSQLALRERLISIGTMVAGVAHEVNNPLSYVISGIELVQREIPAILRGLECLFRGQRAPDREAETEQSIPESPEEISRRVEHLGEFLDMAMHGAERVRDIVRDLTTFSQPEETGYSALAVQPVIEATLRLAWNEIRHRAHLVKEFGEVPPVKANESTLSQALLNLLLNAANAIAVGQADRNEIRVVTSTSVSGLAVIEIRDTGCGIPAENLPHIFDPFYTTKPVGSGTGLGLSICHGIITSIGGTIEVESQVGQGSVVRLQLPAAEAAKPRRQPAAHAIPRGADVPSRVLIIDDEPMLAEAFLHALGDHHLVEAVTSGKDALERVVAGERYTVLLCDLMMPEISGMDLHTLLARLAPDQAKRMVFVTGGPFTPAAREFLEKVDNPRLRKPIGLMELREVVSRAAEVSASFSS